jgi:hypothetical protein
LKEPSNKFLTAKAQGREEGAKSIIFLCAFLASSRLCGEKLVLACFLLPRLTGAENQNYIFMGRVFTNARLKASAGCRQAE